MKLSESERARRVTMMKDRWADPEFRQKQVASVRAWSRTDEYRQHQSAIKRGVPLSEAHVAAIKAAKARRKASKESICE